MVLVKAPLRIIMEQNFCGSIVTLIYYHNYLRLLMRNNGIKKIIYDNYKLFFGMTRYKIVSLTYDQTCWRLLVLNNFRRKYIYDNYKLVLCHDNPPILNPDLLWNMFVIINVKQCQKEDNLWKLQAHFFHDKLHNDNTAPDIFKTTVVIRNKTVFSNAYFVSYVNRKCILQYSRPP